MFFIYIDSYRYQHANYDYCACIALVHINPIPIPYNSAQPTSHTVHFAYCFFRVVVMHAYPYQQPMEFWYRLNKTLSNVNLGMHCEIERQQLQQFLGTVFRVKIDAATNGMTKIQLLHVHPAITCT